ncbi:TonB-dependent receptor [Maricaulaceae bacterium MS644]
MTDFKTRVLASTMLTAAAMTATGAANAQVDTITVTATKVESTTQDIAVTVSALDGSTLQELDVDVFSDYLVQLPGVTAGGSGPGQNTIYIRGVASTTPNLTTAGVAGLAPNVAFYLDEQPLAQPGRNLDVYAVDLERVEVLPGPQGTLFGASSQAGTVRMITNKPVLGVYEAAANFGFSFTEGGEESYSTDVMVNLPISEQFALRGVAFFDRQGGYIDNVPGTIDTSRSARFRPAGTVRANGVPVAPRRAGFQAGADLSDVTFNVADNAPLVEDDFNDTRYQGYRLMGRYEFNADWRATVSVMQQGLDTDGVFFEDPNLGDYEVQRYQPDKLTDEFTNLAWTLEGRLAMLDVVYTGAYTDRESDQVIDYTEYMLVGQYFPYYTCDGSVTYPGAAAPSGTCYSPGSIVTSLTDTQVESHELRFNTTGERYSITAGVFYSSTEVAERNDFTYWSSEIADPFGPFAPNGPYQTGYFSDPGPFPQGVIFRNDILRTDDQRGVFGEATYDIVPNTFAVTLGARYYDIEVDLAGSANGSFLNSGAAQDNQAFGTDISDIYNGDCEYTFRGVAQASQPAPFTCDDSLADITAELLAAGVDPAGVDGAAQQVFNALRAPDVAATEGSIFKLTGTWTPNANMLFFATYSEGFRPGLLNRPGGATTALDGGGAYTVPFALDSDQVTNYELGWKLDLLEDQLRFNGSAFFVDIEDLQTTIFDPSITNLFFSDNAANAEVYGVEGDLTYAPMDLPGLTLTGAFSILDTEITEVLVPTDDVVVGEELAYAPSLQLNARARYEWSVLDGKTAYVQGQAIYSGDSRSDIIEINAIELDSYTTLGLRTGLTSERYSVELFVDNLTNENYALANNFINDVERTTVGRPRTWGVRLGVTY